MKNKVKKTILDAKGGLINERAKASSWPLLEVEKPEAAEVEVTGQYSFGGSNFFSMKSETKFKI
jgi:hypothetical protein